MSHKSACTANRVLHPDHATRNELAFWATQTRAAAVWEVSISACGYIMPDLYRKRRRVRTGSFKPGPHGVIIGRIARRHR